MIKYQKRNNFNSTFLKLLTKINTKKSDFGTPRYSRFKIYNIFRHIFKKKTSGDHYFGQVDAFYRFEHRNEFKKASEV